MVERGRERACGVGVGLDGVLAGRSIRTLCYHGSRLGEAWQRRATRALRS